VTLVKEREYQDDATRERDSVVILLPDFANQNKVKKAVVKSFLSVGFKYLS